MCCSEAIGQNGRATSVVSRAATVRKAARLSEVARRVGKFHSNLCIFADVDTFHVETRVTSSVRKVYNPYWFGRTCRKEDLDECGILSGQSSVAMERN